MRSARRARGRLDCAGGRVRRSGAGILVDLVEDGDEWAGTELVGDGGDFAEAAGLAEGAEEALALAAARGGNWTTWRA